MIRHKNFSSLGTYVSRVESLLQQLLPDSTTESTRLHQAMRYSVLNGGKRLRPCLVYATADALKTNKKQLDASAAAIELIHCYSLVHDDLPAMDDDAIRRGKPSCHKAFDEATAILVGDALQCLAFEILAPYPEAVKTLAVAAGSRGMVSGQAMDLFLQNKTLTVEERMRVHKLKTATLFRASVKMALLATDCNNQKRLQQYDDFALQLGLFYQVQDDVIDKDQTGSTKKEALELLQQAQLMLKNIDNDTSQLELLCDFLNRIHIN